MKNETMTTKRNSAAAVLRRPYVRRLLPDESGGYTATIQEFPGCVAEGETSDDALQNLEKAAASWIEVSLANGREIREPIDFGGCSGKIALRIPRSLHQEVSELAEQEGCSINQVLTAAIAAYVRSENQLHYITNALKQALPTAIYAPPDTRKDWYQVRVNEALTLSTQSGRRAPITVVKVKASGRAIASGKQVIPELAHG